MSAFLVWCVANVVAGAHVRGAGYALGVSDDARREAERHPNVVEGRRVTTACLLTPTSTGRRVCRAWHAWRASTTASRLCRDSHSVGDTAPGTPAGLPSVQRDANTPDVSASTPRGSDTSTGFLCWGRAPLLGGKPCPPRPEGRHGRQLAGARAPRPCQH